MDRWLCAPPTPLGADARLLCLPRSGCAAQDFAGWAERIGTKVHVCSLQLPGRLERFAEPAVDRLEPLVREAARVARSLLDLPLVLFGDCMGALLGFEVARELRRMGAPMPAALLVASNPPPDYHRSGPCYYDAPSQVFKEYLVSIGGVPETALDDEELFELLLPTLRADFAVVETYRYRPEPPIDCAIHVLGGQDDRYIAGTVLEGWKTHTSGTFSRRMFAGDHFFVRKSPDVLTHIQDLSLRSGRRVSS